MRTILVTVLIMFVLGDSEAGTWQVPPNTFKNLITLEVTNHVGRSVDGFSAVIDSVPSWITVNQTTWASDNLPPDSTGMVNIVFDVGFVQSGQKAILVVRILSQGNEIARKTISLQASVPEHYELFQNYPNPFNPTTRIRFALPQTSRVELTIFDMLGRRVKTLIDEERPAGFFTEDWNGTSGAGTAISSGVYYYVIRAAAVNGRDSYSSVRKMMVLK